MDANPHFAKAGTVGNLNATLTADMDKDGEIRRGRLRMGSQASRPTFDIDPDPYKADFSDGASPAGFENAAAVPPLDPATGQQIAESEGGIEPRNWPSSAPN
jgi:hypothetical protein